MIYKEAVSTTFSIFVGASFTYFGLGIEKDIVTHDSQLVYLLVYLLVVSISEQRQFFSFSLACLKIFATFCFRLS